MKHYKHTGKDRTTVLWEGDLPDPITYITAANLSLIGEDRDATIADLQAKLDKQPAEPTKQVVEDNKPGGEPKPKNDVEQFVDTYNSARALYNEV